MYQNAFKTNPPSTFFLSDLPSLLFGEEFEFFGDRPIEEDVDAHIFYVHLKLKNDQAICPHCLTKSSTPHEYTIREVQMLPLNDTTVVGVIHLTRWECKNPDCWHKTFSTRLSAAESYAHRSFSLNTLIFSIALFCSASAAEMICNALGIRVSDDSILRMYKRIEILDDPDIDFIGVDDVAVRKGQTYYTVIYDGNTHHLLAMLEGRDGKELKEWLKEHPEIKKITRDRAGAYAKAIKEILPECVQIADKFHLFQNLLGYLKDIFKNELPRNFYIKDGELLSSPPEKIWSYLDPMSEEEAQKMHYDNSVPTREDGSVIQYDQKLHDPKSRQYQKQAQGRLKKHAMVLKIRKDWYQNEGKRPKKSELANKYNICSASLNKYLNMSEEEVEKIKEITVYKKRRTDMAEYCNIVYKMLADAHTPEIIFRYIRSIDYKGSLSCLADHINMIALNNFEVKTKFSKFCEYTYEKDVTVMSRSDVLKFMTIRDKNKLSNSRVSQFYDLIKSQYSIIAQCEEIWEDFSTVMYSKNEDLIDKFNEKNENGLIKSFINGIRRDIESVKNALSLPETSGFVEGGNCRFKHTKRTMFGRGSLDTLFRKTYAISSIFHLGLSAKEIAKF